jgi:hypothetical protein
MVQAFPIQEFLKSLSCQAPCRIKEHGFAPQFFDGPADIHPAPSRFETRGSAVQLSLGHDMRNT